MAEITKIQNVKSLLRKLEKLERVAHRQNTGNVVVGYNASYALYVHENVEMKWKGEKRHKPHKGFYWDPQGRGQSKFLEQPAREMQGEMQRIIYQACIKGAGLVKALLTAGMFLQRASQKLVPVDTGNLKGSAFTERE